jgi:hypothetical protein
MGAPGVGSKETNTPEGRQTETEKNYIWVYKTCCSDNKIRVDYGLTHGLIPRCRVS